MSKVSNKRVQTDVELKKKAIKLVLSHIKKKIPEQGTNIEENLKNWILEMECLLQKDGFQVSEYVDMRKNLNELIESVSEDAFRYKLRDSWFSFGKAMYKTPKRY